MKDVVLITGASTGFGRATAELLAQAGYSVIATMLGSTGHNAETRAEIARFAHVVELDVASDASVEQGVEKALEIFGRIDVVINNAGCASMGVTEAHSIDEFQRVFDTNFFGVLRVNRAVLPGMRARRKGLLIHVSSVLGRSTLPYMAAYCASKHALESLSDAYRFELMPFGIDCVVVEPGVFQTPIFAKPPVTAADVSRAEEYGDQNHTQCVMEGFTRILSEPDLPPMRVVAEVFQKLIETPPSERPLRTYVGGGIEFLEFFNAASEQIRTGLAEVFGVSHLLTASSAREAAQG